MNHSSLNFLKAAAGMATVSVVGITQAETATTKKRLLKKGYMLNTFPGGRKGLSVMEKFQLLKEAGFDGVEPSSELDPNEVLKARDATGLLIASMSCGNGTRSFSSANANTRKKAVQTLQKDLRIAKQYGASSVLVVPGGVSAEVSYTENYKRSRDCIKECISVAEDVGVKMAIENVWNNFLLSPVEAARFVDDFKSPMVGWHFDVGNCIYIGWPEHWIQALGNRIAKVHIKEFSRKQMEHHGPRVGFAVEYLEGDNDWPSVMKVFDAVGYNGWFIIESACATCKEGMEPIDYLKSVSEKLDKIIAM